MGGGKRSKPDIRRGPPVNVLDGLSGSGPADVDVCVQPRVVDFVLAAAAQAGALVTVLGGTPPRVLHAGEQIGVLTEEDAAGVERCVEQGYEMTGVIDTVGAAGATGRLRLSGQLT